LKKERERITNANGVYCVLLPLLNSQSVLRAEKTKFYKTLIKPVATGGAASWALRTDIAIRLVAFEGKALKRMFGGI
jgi:hypothetical protein